MALLLLLSRIAAGLFENAISSDWPRREREIDSTKSAAIQRAFRALTARPYEAVRELAAAHASLLAAEAVRHAPEAAEQVFALFSECAARKGVSLELYDSEGILRAYEGRPLGVDSIRRSRILSPSELVSTDGFFRFSVYAEPVVDSLGIRRGLLLGAVPLEIAFPLHNRILQSSGFRDDIREEMHVDLAIDYDGKDEREKDGRYSAVPLSGQEGQRAATGYFLKTAPGSYLPFVRSRFNMVSSFLALLLIGLLSIAAARWYGSGRPRPLVFTVSAALHLWIVRFLLLFTGIPQSLLPESLFNPVFFASDFGWGLTSSPGELFLTSLCLFLTALLLFRLSGRGAEHPAPQKRNSFVAGMGLAALLCLLPLLVRAYAAAIRSFVFDSTFQFEDVSSLFHQPLFFLMLTCIFLVTAGMLLLWGAILGGAHRLSRLLPAARFRFPAAAAATGVAFLLMYAAMSDPLYSPAVYTGAGILAALLLLFRMPAHPATLPGSLLARGFLLSILVLALFVPTLFRYTDQKRSDAVALMAREYAQPVDGWTMLLLSQTVEYLQQQTDSARAERDEAGIQEAFHLWARSPLSSQPNHSALLIRRPSGRSRFAIGLTQEQLRTIEQEAGTQSADSVRISKFPHLPGSPEQTIYAAALPLTDSEGGKSGDALIAIVAGSSIQPAGSQTDILRSATSRPGIVPEEKFIFTRFARGRLRYSNDPSVPRGIPPPPAAADARGTEAQGRWDGLPAAGGNLRTYFIPLPDSAGGGMLGISIPPVERTYVLYRVFRFGLVFLLLSLLFLALASWRPLFDALRQRNFSFASRLHAAFILIAVIPITLYWVSNGEFVRTRSEERLNLRLDGALRTAARNIIPPGRRTLPDSLPPGEFSHERCAAMAFASGNEINIYSAERLVASSRPELYETRLLSPRPDAGAYREIYLHGRDLFIARETIGAFPYLVGYKPLRGGDGVPRAMIAIPLLFEQQSVEEEYVRATATLFLWSFVGFVLILLISTLVANQIARSMRDLTRAAKDIALGDYSRRIPATRRDEIGDFIRAFNRMTEQVAQSRRELAEAERELAWREMAKQVAHEIRNPLTPMKLAAQHLLQAYRDGAAHIGAIIEQVSRTILEQIEALTRISSAFSLFARMPRRDVRPVDVPALIRETIALFAHHSGIRFRFDAEEQAEIPADRDELQRCFINLISNAVQAMGAEGLIDIAARRQAGNLVVEIRDTGGGIPPAILPRILEPSFSTKTDGMGLGLPIVKKILDDMGASIEIESEPGRGTTVRIRFPAEGTEREGGTPAAAIP